MKWVWLSIAFSVVVLVVVLATTVDENTLRYVLGLNLWFLFLAFVFRVASLVAWAFRIKTMSKALGYQVSFSHSFNLVLANLLAGAVTPGQAGGEPVRIHELYRADVKVGDATAVVIMERVLDGIILILMGVIAMIFLGSAWAHLSLGILIVMMVAWVLMGAVILVLFIAARRPEAVKARVMRILHWIGDRTKREGVRKAISQADYEMDNFFSSVNRFTGASRRGLIFGSFFTVIFWASEFFVASLLLLSLGQPPFVAESYLFQLVIAVIMMIPLTPGSSGVAEISATSLYALIIPSSVLGIFVLLWRILLYYFNIAVGLVASLLIFRRELSAEPVNRG
jgi:uncharacterized protein (TIRG00374 family)